MAKFLGKWRCDHSYNLDNFDQFAEAAGLPQDVVDKLKTATSTVEFIKNGDTWTARTESSISQPADYHWTPGVGGITTDSFGKGFKYHSSFVSESKMVVIEQAEIMNWKQVLTTREVIGDKIITNKQLPGGIKMSQEHTRC